MKPFDLYAYTSHIYNITFTKHSTDLHSRCRSGHHCAIFRYKHHVLQLSTAGIITILFRIQGITI
jgi:hypothetical protein